MSARSATPTPIRWWKSARLRVTAGITFITAAVFAALQATSWSTATGLGFGLIAGVILMALAVAYKDLHDRRGGTTPHA